MPSFHFWATVCKNGSPYVIGLLSVLSYPVCNGGVSWPNGRQKNSAHVYGGQKAGWIKMVFGTEVGLIPGDFVLDGDPVPSPKGGGLPPSPIFGPFLLWLKGWMHQDATWYGGRPHPRRLYVRWGPCPSPKRGGAPLPNFRPISIVAKRLDASRCHLVWT